MSKTEKNSKISSISDIEEIAEKIIIIGTASVGKTSILTRYIKKTFPNQQKPTIGCDQFIKEQPLSQKNRRIRLSIWDTAGQERYKGLASSYYKNSKCVIFVFDLTNKESFENLENWREEMLSYSDEGILVVVIGNKNDLEKERVVRKEEIEFFCKKYDYYYMELSAKIDDGKIDKVFSYIGEVLFQNIVKAGGSFGTKVLKDGVSKIGEEKEDGCKC